jgi:predicted DNA-binding transcriptional regulator AlpA
LRPEGELLPPGVHRLSEAMEGVVERLALRLDEVSQCLGVSRRLIERERAAGRFPPPDRTIGRVPLWSRETLVRWISEGGDNHDGR